MTKTSFIKVNGGCIGYVKKVGSEWVANETIWFRETDLQVKAKTKKAAVQAFDQAFFAR